MAEALKMGQEDATGEFELPESFKKKTEELKKEQEKINLELEMVKAEPVVRQQDESTRVFHLREHQMEAKLRELEARKQKTEKELNALLQQKNVKLHDHLRKVTQVLVHETKKIAPLEKDLESGVAKISNLKNEMQQLFEQNIDDRKKNAELIGEQAREIEMLNSLLKQTTGTLTKDFHLVTQSLERLYREKSTLNQSLLQLNEEIQHKTQVVRGLEEKEAKLEMIEASIKTFKDKSSELMELEKILQNKKEDLHRLKEEGANLERVNSHTELRKLELQSTLSKLELSQKEFDSRLELKRDELKRLEDLCLEQSAKLEGLKKSEYDHLKSIGNQEVQLAHITNELKRLEGSRALALQMEVEAQKYCQEKKDFYGREMELHEIQHREKMARLDLEMENKKLTWEKEFKFFVTQKEQELEERLAFLEQRDLEELHQKYRSFQEDIVEAFRSVYFKEGFSTLDEKAHEVKKDLNSLFEKHFGTLPRWKFW